MRRRIGKRLAKQRSVPILGDFRVQKSVVERQVPARQQLARQVHLKTTIADLAGREHRVGVGAGRAEVGIGAQHVLFHDAEDRCRELGPAAQPLALGAGFQLLGRLRLVGAIGARGLGQQRRARESVGGTDIDRQLGPGLEDDTDAAGGGSLVTRQRASTAQSLIVVTIDPSPQQQVDARAERDEVLQVGTGAACLGEVGRETRGGQAIAGDIHRAVDRGGQRQRLHRTARTRLACRCATEQEILTDHVEACRDVVPGPAQSHRHRDAGREGPIVVAAELIPELALHQRAVAGDAAGLVIVLGAVVAQIAEGCIQPRTAADRLIEPRLYDLGLKVGEVRGLGGGPAIVGQKVAVGVDRNTAQPMRAVTLVDVFVLEAERRSCGRLECQPAHCVEIANAGVVAEAVAIFEVHGAAIEQRLAGVGGSGDLSFCQRLAELAGADRGARVEQVARLLGHVVDDAAGLAGSIQHRRGPLEHFDPFEVAQAELAGAEARVVDVAVEAAVRIALDAVDQHFALREATHHRRTVRTVGHAADEFVEILGVERANVLDQPGGQDHDGLGDIDQAGTGLGGTGAGVHVIAEAPDHRQFLDNGDLSRHSHVDRGRLLPRDGDLLRERREAAARDDDGVCAGRHFGDGEPPIRSRAGLILSPNQQHRGPGHRLAGVVRHRAADDRTGRLRPDTTTKQSNCPHHRDQPTHAHPPAASVCRWRRRGTQTPTTGRLRPTNGCHTGE